MFMSYLQDASSTLIRKKLLQKLIFGSKTACALNFPFYQVCKTGW